MSLVQVARKRIQEMYERVTGRRVALGATYAPSEATRPITVGVAVAAITRFDPPASASFGESISIPIEIQNVGDVDIFESTVFLYDADTGERLFRGYNAPLNAGEVVDYTAIVTMPNKDLNLLLELEIATSPVATPEIVDSRTATITLAVPILTALTISAPVSVLINEPFTINGILTRVDTGAGIDGQTINVYYNTTIIGSVVTGADGSYSITAAIPTAGSYTLKAEFPGSEVLGMALAGMPVAVGEIIVCANYPWLKEAYERARENNRTLVMERIKTFCERLDQIRG